VVGTTLLGRLCTRTGVVLPFFSAGSLAEWTATSRRCS
jgi:hypothetical protein